MFRKKYYIKKFEKPPSKLLIFSKKILLLLLTLFIGNFIFNIYFYKTDIQTAVLINPIATQLVKTATTLINSSQNSTELEKIILPILGNEKDNFAVVVFNLETGERYYLNEDKIYDTASLYKLWVMVVSYEQIEQKKFAMTDVLADSTSSINKKFGLDSVDNQSSTFISWSVQNALLNMITISDNDSAYLLTEKVGIDNITNFLNANGFSESKVGNGIDNPKSSASDMAIFLERLYNGKLANQEDTSEMINLLKSQQVNTKVTKYLPNDAVVGHKTGELGSFSHDVGIVFLPKGNYIIAVLSKTQDQLEANEKIANISKNVYSYFLNK